MKKNEVSVSNAQVANAAKKEVKQNNASPLYILHKLNKLAKGVAGVAEKSESLKELQRRCGCGAKGFTFTQLPQHEGRICKLRPYNGNFTWNNVVQTYCGAYELVPISTTENGVITALKSYADYRARIEKDLRADKSTKAKKWTKKQLFAALKAGEITEAEFIQLWEAA